jgi:hypothetical protein
MAAATRLEGLVRLLEGCQACLRHVGLGMEGGSGGLDSSTEGAYPMRALVVKGAALANTYDPKYMSRIGKTGGLSRSDRKLAAAKENAKKATEARKLRRLGLKP